MDYLLLSGALTLQPEFHSDQRYPEKRVILAALTVNGIHDTLWLARPLAFRAGAVVLR